MKKRLWAIGLILGIGFLSNISTVLAEETNLSNEALQQELQDLKELVHELEHRLEENERKDADDKINLKGELFLQRHQFYYNKSKSLTQPDSIRERSGLSQIRFRLNMRSDVVEDLRFTGRVTMFKNWGENVALYADRPDFNASGVPSDSTLRLERAYFDYFLNSTLSFSMGRLPGGDGPPSEFVENTPRKSTFPQALYNVELDGVVVSINLPQWSLFDSAIRYIYGEHSYTQSGSSFVPEAQALPINIWQFESEFQLGKTQGLLILDHLRVDRIPFSDTQIEELKAGVELLLQAQTGTAVQTEVTEHPNSIGYVEESLMHMQFTNIAGLKLDWYGTYDAVNISDNSKQIVLSLQGTDTPVACYSMRKKLHDCTKPPKKLTLHGYAINTGVRYELPIRSLNNPKVGMEYHWASKDYTGTGFRSSYGSVGGALDFNNVLGVAQHFYLVYPVQRNLHMRLGHYLSRQEYGGVIGSSVVDKATLTDTYLALKAMF